MIIAVYRDPAALEATISHLHRVLDQKDRRVLELETRLQRRQADLDALRVQAREWERWDELQQRFVNALVDATAELGVLHGQVARLQQDAGQDAALIEALRHEVERLQPALGVAS